MLSISGVKYDDTYSLKFVDIFDLVLTSDSYMSDNGWFIKSIRYRTEKDNIVDWFDIDERVIKDLKNDNWKRYQLEANINFISIEFKK